MHRRSSYSLPRRFLRTTRWYNTYLRLQTDCLVLEPAPQRSLESIALTKNGIFYEINLYSAIDIDKRSPPSYPAPKMF
mgnify:CR=1 FL=1